MSMSTVLDLDPLCLKAALFSILRGHPVETDTSLTRTNALDINHNARCSWAIAPYYFSIWRSP
jgi:hypothetical protein